MVSGEFDKAADKQEAWRRAQIAALSPEQRTGYEAVRARHDRSQEELREQQASEERAHHERRMTELLRERAAPELRPPGTQKRDKSPEMAAAIAAVPDYLDGKNTPQVEASRAVLTQAHARASTEYTAHCGGDLQRLTQAQQRQSDGYLRDCVRKHELGAASRRMRAGFSRARTDRVSGRFNAAAKEEWER